MSQRYLGGVITANPTTPTLASLSGVWTLEQQFQYFNVWSPEIVGNSVRLRSSASAYFNRTPSVSGNLTTWTYSAWVKLGTISVSRTLLAAGLISGTIYYNRITLNSNGTIGFFNYPDTGPNAGWLNTAQVLRDPSAWYHIVAVWDTTNATSTERMRLYVNGVRITDFVTNVFAPTYPNQNTASLINSSSYEQRIGRTEVGQTNGDFFDGYLAEINFINGQALTPSSFGAFDSTGVWQPLPYTGAYGTNGFYLTFSDNSGATATTIGRDSSGNGNNWTPNNISVTPGVTYDWMLDSPTNWTAGTGNGVANYPVFNAIKPYGGAVSITNGNLTATNSSNFTIDTTFGVSSGQYYCELTATTVATRVEFGIALNYNWAVNYRSDGQKNVNGTLSSYGATWTSGDVIGMAFDIGASTVTFYKNGVSQGQITGITYYSADNCVTVYGIAGSVHNINFGQRPFAYTPPTGFRALNTLNLPTPTITNGAAWMAASLYTGNAGSITVTNTVNGTSFQPDLVWVKARSSAFDNKLVDSVRGASGGIYYDLSSNSAAAQSLPGAGVNGLTSTGFTIGGGTNNGYNGNGTTFVAWQWQAGKGTTSTNTSGTITSTVSANTTAGFSIVRWTGTGASGTTGHGLGVAPKFLILKDASNGYNWYVFTTATGSNVRFEGLNTTAAATSAPSQFTTTSTLITNIPSDASLNTSGATMILYCFAPVTGYSAFGSYTGNGSADGPFVYLGFRPRWLMIKLSSGVEDWRVYDTSRSTFNVMGEELYPNSSGAAGSVTFADFTSNGFKIRNSGSGSNSNGGTYIYACFAENPFNISRAR
jgi:hypothetical protein